MADSSDRGTKRNVEGESILKVYTINKITQKDWDDLNRQVVEMKELMKLDNEKLGDLHNLLRISNEETKNAQASMEAHKEEVSHGLLRVIQHLETFPSIFSTTEQWKNYSDIECESVLSHQQHLNL